VDRAFQTASHLPSPPHPAGQAKVDSANDNMYNKDFLVWQEKFGLLWRWLLASPCWRWSAASSPESLPSWPGLSRPSTRRRLGDESRQPGDGLNGASGTKLFDLAVPSRSFSMLKHVDGWDKPRQDALGPVRAAPIFGTPWFCARQIGRLGESSDGARRGLQPCDAAHELNER
jgi:hypothetical protein